MKLVIAALVLSVALFAAVVPAGAHGLAKDQQWGSHGNISQAAAEAAGSYAVAGRLQAQANFSLNEWTSLPEATLVWNLQTLLSNPGAMRLFSEDQLEQLRMLASQRGIAIAAPEAVGDGDGPWQPAARG